MTGIILGTANLSNDYGLLREKNNTFDFYNDLIDHAIILGIKRFDTARGYGKSEATLGMALEEKSEIKIDTKINAIYCSNSDEVLDQIRDSIATLKISQIETLYIHDSSILRSNKSEFICESLIQARTLGLIKNIGISIYTEDELSLIKSSFMIVNTIQVPENVCDRRLINNEILFEMSANGVEINLRSIFLQGLLTMNSNDLPTSLNSGYESVRSLERFSEINGISRVDICVAYAKSIPWASNIIVGTNSIEQLKQVLDSNKKLTRGWEEEIIKLPANLVDPRKWII
jgi:aryl-alcohol dehydrogenase-like predicted oxidoreductase